MLLLAAQLLGRPLVRLRWSELCGRWPRPKDATGPRSRAGSAGSWAGSIAAALGADEHTGGVIKASPWRVDFFASAAQRQWKRPTLMGSYRLWYPSAVFDEPIFDAHREQLLQRAQAHRILLHIQDTTELDYTAHKTIEGLGPLSDKSRRGLFAWHSIFRICV